MRQSWLLGLIALLALAGGVLLALVIAPPQSPRFLQLYPEPRDIPAFSLTDQHGQALTKARLQGQWTLVFLGYTFCPDICPTTLAELNRIYGQLQQQTNGAPVRVLFVSVDPKRDNSNRLKEYTGFFNPAFTAASAPHPQLFPFVKSLGMLYSMPGSTDAEYYSVDHSSSVVVLDPQVRMLGRFKPSLNDAGLPVVQGDHILADIGILTGN